MLGPILKHEWRNLAADRTLWAVGGLLALLLACGLIKGTGWVHFQQQTLAAAAQEETGRLAGLKADLIAIEQGRKAPPDSPFSDPRQPRTVGANRGTRYAVLPPGPLAAFAVGQSDLYPYYFRVSALSKQTFLQNDELENPTNLLVGPFDPAFVVIYLYPLLILALGYNLISGERDEGTLALLLSQPVSLGTVVLGKVLVRGTLVVAIAAGLTLAGALLGGVDLTPAGSTGVSAEGIWLRLGLWIAVIALYGAFWLALAAAVGSLGCSSAANAAILTGLWLLFVVLIPAGVNVAVTTLSPVPSRIELVQAAREATNAVNAQGSRLLARYYEDHPELLPRGGRVDAQNFALRSTALREAVDRAVAPILERYDRQLVGQQELVARYRFLSPAIVAQEALNDLAGTGLDRYRHFLAQVDVFHRQWQAIFVPRIFRQQPMTSADIGRLPSFRYQEEAVSAVIVRVLPGLAGLALPAILLAWLALPGLRRYPVMA